MDRLSSEWLARSGYAARGIVYILVGGMALLSTVGGGEADSKSAMQMVLEQPLGAVWLGLIGIGLVGFIVWRLAQAILNADQHDNNMKAYVIRAAMFVSAVTYTGLASYAIGQALKISFGSGSGNSRESWTAWLMQQPFGPYLVAALGLVVIGAGAVQVYKGVTRRYEKFVRISGGHKRLLDLLCIYGLAARGVIFAIIGGFFLYAAWAADPQQGGSTADALAWVRSLPFGGVLYGLAALGLFAFGAYGVIEARYRIIREPSLSEARHALRT
ncbi:conserved membrane protein of unknown function [Pseudorhizobium banfieldiae]|uniref:DUF1206 domain-containing protein n=1 Tax=Pseudorhizobium banfieldiae TaxID=1125847 RepID=L0NGC6_9HYPH|nr:DUF1206 domain-containing protein [Pseudorhizobium banfieldiae]CAD6613424.1 hypothetical protein RNT25_02570 [arsenite-oxidising bacterium NT-25]CCF19939.1 conserved membrane protein of unknown function [Pseudorhizobium banfieldiae]